VLESSVDAVWEERKEECLIEDDNDGDKLIIYEARDNLE
jgi:hypothetical protein